MLLDSLTGDLFVLAQYLTAAPGDRVVVEGGVADVVYLVVSGDLVATRGTPPRPLARLSEGAFFGEMALRTDAPRLASVSAARDSLLFEIHRPQLAEIARQHPKANAKTKLGPRASSVYIVIMNASAKTP